MIERKWLPWSAENMKNYDCNQEFVSESAFGMIHFEMTQKEFNN